MLARSAYRDQRSGSWRSIGSQLTTDGRQLFWTDYGRILRVEVDASPSTGPGDIEITGLEVTQGIQTVNEAIPLLAGKRTFVRVYVRSREDDRGAWTGVTARFWIEDSFSAAAPIGSSQITAMPSGSSRDSNAGTFVFSIPPEALGAGSRQCEVRISPPPGRPEADTANNSRVKRLAFGPLGEPVTLTCYMLRYRYTNVDPATQRAQGLSGPVWPERSLADFEPHREVAENMLPLASLRFVPFPGDPVGQFDYRTGSGYEDAKRWAVMMADREFSRGQATVVLLQPESERLTGTNVRTGVGNQVINLQHVLASAGEVMAHEIGHGLGLGHPLPYEPSFTDPGYNRDETTGANVGFRYVGTAAEGWPGPVPGQNADGSVRHWEVMSYQSPVWISPYSYCRALRTASGGRLMCSRGLGS